jgi:hypothetical protein
MTGRTSLVSIADRLFHFSPALLAFVNQHHTCIHIHSLASKWVTYKAYCSIGNVCSDLECMYFLDLFFARLCTTLSLMLSYCRYRSIAADLREFWIFCTELKFLFPCVSLSIHCIEKCFNWKLISLIFVYIPCDECTAYTDYSFQCFYFCILMYQAVSIWTTWRWMVG